MAAGTEHLLNIPDPHDIVNVSVNSDCDLIIDEPEVSIVLHNVTECSECDSGVNLENLSLITDSVDNDTTSSAVLNPEGVHDVNDNETTCEGKVKILRNEYPNNVIIAHLNVNSFRPKFDEVRELLISGKFDVLVLSETKLDSTNQNAILEINDYTIYRQDKRSNSGGLMAYVSNNITSTIGPVIKCNDNMECMTIELILNGNKILVACIYKNPKMKPNEFKSNFEETCEKMFDKYDNVIIIGDLNFNMLNNNMLSQICPTFNLNNIIKEPTCFKSNNPTLIDVMLVSKRRKYIKGFSIDTGISDFHNLIGGILRLHAPIPKQKVVHYRKLSDINYDIINLELAEMKIDEVVAAEDDINNAFDKLQKTLISLLDKHAPKKKKIVKLNDFPCMTKRLKKAILIRNQYRNKFFKHRSITFLAAYRKHRNLVTQIKREETKKYFEEKCKGATKNKDFWRAIKPFFSKSGKQ